MDKESRVIGLRYIMGRIYYFYEKTPYIERGALMDKETYQSIKDALKRSVVVHTDAGTVLHNVRFKFSTGNVVIEGSEIRCTGGLSTSENVIQISTSTIKCSHIDLYEPKRSDSCICSSLIDKSVITNTNGINVRDSNLVGVTLKESITVEGDGVLFNISESELFDITCICGDDLVLDNITIG